MYWVCCLVVFCNQKTAYEMLRSLVGSEMCIRDRIYDREDWYKINRYFVLYGRYSFNIDLLNEIGVNKEENYISS